VPRLTWGDLVAIGALVAGGPVLVLSVLGAGACTTEADLVVERPAEAVAAARAQIAGQREERYFLRPEQLPEALRIRGLRYAHVHRDHVDLVLARNPDWEVGGRIWAAGHRPHADAASRYPEIHFYQYTNDAPESPDNIR
jgi:hypothetical protein